VNACEEESDLRLQHFRVYVYALFSVSRVHRGAC